MSDKKPTPSKVKKFLADYMESDTYQKRLNNFPDSREVIVNPNDVRSIRIIHDSTNGSSFTYVPTKKGNKVEMANIVISPTDMQIHPEQFGSPAYTNNAFDYEEALAHELSHASRKLGHKEILRISDALQNPIEDDVRKKWDKLPKNKVNEYINTGREFNMAPYESYLIPQKYYYDPNAYDNSVVTDMHDLQPSENKADLDALRYQMYKYGIYDTKKGNIDKTTLKKALEHPKIKDSITTKRLLLNFTLEDIMKLNNTIAGNRYKQPRDPQDYGVSYDEYDHLYAKEGLGTFVKNNADPIATGANAIADISETFAREGKANVGLRTGQGALKGAAMGMQVGGPIGAAAGLAIGGLTSFIGANKEKREMREQAQEAYDAQELETYGKNVTVQSDEERYGTNFYAAEGGMPGLIDNNPTDPNKPKSPFGKKERGIWNGFTQFVADKGYKGSKDLDSRDKGLSKQLWGDYTKQNNLDLEYDTFIPQVQSEISAYRNNVINMARQGKAQIPSEDQFMQGLSKVDGWAGSRTTSWKFPEETAVDTLIAPNGKKLMTERANVAYKQYEEGGMIDYTQEPAPVRVNIERGELRVDADGKILEEYKNPNRYFQHNKNAHLEPQGNFVEVNEGEIIVPVKFAKRYKAGDDITRKSILRSILEQQKANPEQNLPDAGRADYKADEGVVIPKSRQVFNPTMKGPSITNLLPFEDEQDRFVQVPQVQDTPAGSRTNLNNLIHHNLPLLAQTANMLLASKPDTLLQKEYNSRADDALSYLQNLDDTYDVSLNLARNSSSLNQGLDFLDDINSPAARVQASEMLGRTLEANNQVMQQKNQVESQLRNQKKQALSNFIYGRGEAERGEDLRYQQEARMNEGARRSEISAAINNMSEIVQQQNVEREKIKALNSMTEFHDLDPRKQQLIMEDPVAKDKILRLVNAGYSPQLAFKMVVGVSDNDEVRKTTQNKTRIGNSEQTNRTTYIDR